jgi:hypothetical protein
VSAAKITQALDFVIDVAAAELAAAVVRLAQILKGRRRCSVCWPERDYGPSVPVSAS